MMKTESILIDIRAERFYLFNDHTHFPSTVIVIGSYMDESDSSISIEENELELAHRRRFAHDGNSLRTVFVLYLHFVECCLLERT